MIVKFISYNGEYPNLCSGRLIVDVDGKKFEINHLVSGGLCGFDEQGNEELEEGPWSISNWPDDFPEEAKAETEKVANDNIPHGCCGGCL